MGGDSLGDGPYGTALIYRAECNLNQAHGAQFAAWAARPADYAADGTGSGQTAATAASAAAKSKRAGS